jgi:CheY-like chemotaxis protein
MSSLGILVADDNPDDLNMITSGLESAFSGGRPSG